MDGVSAALFSVDGVLVKVFRTFYFKVDHLPAGKMLENKLLPWETAPENLSYIQLSLTD
jgi:hypothetical protein